MAPPAAASRAPIESLELPEVAELDYVALLGRERSRARAAKLRVLGRL